MQGTKAFANSLKLVSEFATKRFEGNRSKVNRELEITEETNDAIWTKAKDKNAGE
jgi:hypothetical protein